MLIPFDIQIAMDILFIHAIVYLDLFLFMDKSERKNPGNKNKRDGEQIIYEYYEVEEVVIENVTYKKIHWID